MSAYSAPKSETILAVKNAEQLCDILVTAAAVLPQIQDDTAAVAIAVQNIFQIAFADVTAERTVTYIGHLAVTDSVMEKTEMRLER